jgi:hypothetical protein
MCILKARRSRWAFSTATFWLRDRGQRPGLQGYGAARGQAAVELLSRRRGKTVLWPHIEAEYQAELKGIAEG